jgi:hypothetical protein
MTEKGQQIINDYLKSIKPNQPFTIEDLVRTVGQNLGGQWAGTFEIQLQEEIKNYLIDQGLINEYGTTKLYTIDKKVSKL